MRYPSRTAVPFWGQTTWNLSGLFPKNGAVVPKGSTGTWGACMVGGSYGFQINFRSTLYEYTQGVKALHVAGGSARYARSRGRMERKFQKEKYPRPLSCNYFPPDCNTLHRSKNISNSRASLSLVRSLPLSRPPRYRFGPGKTSLPLCHSEPRRPPRVKPGAHHGPRSAPRHCCCSDCAALSVSISLVVKITHRSNFILQTKTTLKNSYII